MKNLFALIAAGLLSAAALQAGTIVGTVRAEGKSGAEADVLCGKYDSRQFKFAERINYADLTGFVVYIDGLTLTNGIQKDPVQVVTRRVSQRGALFSPHILPVLVGTTVEWPNYDEILHNVFSFSETKQFDLGLYKSPEVGRVTFDKPGRVDVYCSIHARMSCIILVLANPFFCVANERGAFKIANVPAGTYRLKVWHERLPAETRTLVVPETGDVKADFVLGIKNLPKS